jgi:hypothetical protein
MKKSLRSRVVQNHGLITNIIWGLDLFDQVKISNLCGRCYEITVPWNTTVKFPEQYVSVFPMIDDVSDDYICKVTETTIKGEKGDFYGPVSKLTGLPSGEGVFVTEESIHFGKVH